MSESQIIVKLNPDTPPTGSDLSIVNSARRSFGKRSEWVYSGVDTNGPHEKALKAKDKRLLEFLARGMTADDFEAFVNSCVADGYMVEDQGDWEYYHQTLVEKLWQWRNTPTHESPFGHAFFSFEVKMPIFLARQLVKHKFLRWSEYSRRYITEDVEFYRHDYREAAQDKKQGSGGNHKYADKWLTEVDTRNLDSLAFYNSMVRDGVAPEQARGHLPQDLMTAVTWSGSLDAFANMCKLRLGSDAQKEAQYVAQEVYKHLRNQCPVAAPLLVEGVK